MFLLPLAVVLQTSSPNFTRDDFGVPHVQASNQADGWRAAGYAVAEDRLWQMEMSRHQVRGRISEILGSSGLASDREVLKTAYTDQELQGQLDRLKPELRNAFISYAQGINDFMGAGKLPPEYAKYGIKPEPWTTLDSAAISVWLLQYFGRGGAGAIRNMLALSYLQGQKPIQGHVLDVLDDFLWQNDPSSPTTIFKEDESADHPTFVPPSREITEKHLAMLPKLTMFELLPGLNVASRAQSTRVAERVGAPFRTGSYCMVVGSKRSGTGMPLLLSGPQMGFTDPSIVHELSIDTPQLHVAGMDVPGIPGILVGHTRHLAWGITSGVADTDDIVFAPLDGADGYKSDGSTKPLARIPFRLHVKGGADETVTEERTHDAVVLMKTNPHGNVPGYLLARRSSYRNRELQSLESIAGIWTAANVKDEEAAVSTATMSFNVFGADDSGHIAYRYGGSMPIRTDALDPRFPVPDDSQYAWKGFIPPAQMPHVIDPKGGLITNWNNKPASWWPNLDTPVWGKIFRVSSIRANLQSTELNIQDLELAAWKIARSDESWPFFKPYWDKALLDLRLDKTDPAAALAQQEAGGFEGAFLDGSRQANIYKHFMRELRIRIFTDSVGTFLNENTLALVAQPSAMLEALQGKTKFNFLHGRAAGELAKASLLAAVRDEIKDQSRYVPGQIKFEGEAPIPYSNRGTYIQVIELLADGPLGRNINPPGVAATGPHSRDQVPLSRAWIYKPMLRPWKSSTP